jgi:hypothetical protein
MFDYAAGRMDICEKCDHFSNFLKTCKLCGCFLPGKTIIKSSACPDNPPRWTAESEHTADCNCKKEI